MGHEYGHGLAVSSSGTSTREEFFQVHSEAFLPHSALHRQYTNGCLLLHSQRRISPALVYKGKVLFGVILSSLYCLPLPGGIVPYVKPHIFEMSSLLSELDS